MADRRMFHKNVVESDAFLDMPTSSQALYFHIGMYADDDGFVNGPRRIARLIGADNEDLQLLIDNRFLLAFTNGVVVIKHWRMANSLKSDRTKMPQYPELATQIYIKENRSYTDHPAEGAVSLLEYKQKYMESKRNPDGILSEGKGTEMNRTEENERENGNTKTDKPPKPAHISPPSVDDVRAYCGKQGYTTIDPERFVSYYAARQWMAGQTAITDWRAAVDSWHRKDMDKNGNGQSESKPLWTVGTVV